MFVAVGQGTVAYSVDGVTWIENVTLVNTFNAVVWDPVLKLAVAVGASCCMTSPDGINWTQQVIPAGTYNAITSNGTHFVAVGDTTAGAGCVTSTDGVNWTVQVIPAGLWLGIDWNPTLGIYAAVGSGIAASSPDGVTWTSRVVPINPISGVTDRWNAVTFVRPFATPLFVAVGAPQSGTGTVVMTSPDAVTWTWQASGNLNNVGNQTGFSGVAWNTTTSVHLGVTKVVAIGVVDQAAPATPAATSIDGVTWTQRVIPTVSVFTDLAWDDTAGGGKFFAMATGNPPEGSGSFDGITWDAPIGLLGYYAGITGNVPNPPVPPPPAGFGGSQEEDESEADAMSLGLSLDEIYGGEKLLKKKLDFFDELEAEDVMREILNE